MFETILVIGILVSLALGSFFAVKSLKSNRGGRLGGRSSSSAFSGDVTNNGTFVTQEDGAALTALQIIDNFISGSRGLVTEDSAAAALTALQLLDDSISGPGALVVDSYANIAINLTTGANQVLVSSAANKQIWVYGYGFLCGSDGVTVSFQDEDDVAVTGIMPFAQRGGKVVAPSGNFSMPVHKLATNKDLEVDITGGDVDGWLAYAIISV